MIRAQGISVSRRGRAILDGVDLRAESGRVAVVLGANGAGKSTLLRVLTGELLPDAGGVELAGRPLRAWSRHDLARVRAVVTQASPLNFPFAVIEVVLQGAAARRRRESETDLRVAIGALEAVDLLGFAERDYLTLSGGERQRVQIARAFAQLGGEADGRCLLLDEPTASLDLGHQHGVLRLVRRFAERGGCAVVVLHDLHLCATYADDVCLLNRGRVSGFGNASSVLTGERLTAAYGIHVAPVAGRNSFFDVSE